MRCQVRRSGIQPWVSIAGASWSPSCDRQNRVQMSHHSDLIDTTEMYLRTVYELEEEGVVALRFRIAERLGQSIARP